MAELPVANDLIGSTVTEAQFKSSLGVLVENVASKTYADTKKTEAISAAATDATNKANTAETNAKNYADANPLFKPTLFANPTDLNTITAVGFYLTSLTGNATLALNYPSPGLTGVLTVFKATGTSLIVQTYLATTGATYYRQYNGTVWSAWADTITQPRLAPFLASYQTLTGAIGDRGLLAAGTDLDTLLTAGFYTQNNNANATLALHYPVAAAGLLRVNKSAATSFCIQEYVSAVGDSYTRSYNGSVWSAWSAGLSQVKIDPFLSNYALKSQSLVFNATLLDTDDLNNFKSMGMWIQTLNLTNWVELNYPVKSFGILQVMKSPTSSLVFQRYITPTATYTRYWNASVWSAWSSNASTSTGSYDIKAVLASTDNLDDFKTFGIWLRNTSSAVDPALNWPTNKIGILKVYKGAVSSLVIQEYVCAIDSIIYTRYWNATVWSAWVANAAVSASASGANTLNFTKSDTALTFYQEASGTNSDVC